MNMANRTVQNRLKDLRAEGKSYAQIGRELGVSRSLVSRWAKGTRKPSKKKREAIYRRWRKQDKRLRNKGATVNLTSYFRRVWFENGLIQLPLNYRNIPPYDFPNNAPVRVLVVFRELILLNGDGDIQDFGKEPSIQETLSPNEDIAQAVERKFDEYVEQITKPTNLGGSGLRLLRVEIDRVLLQWLKR